ncbi:MAG: hypothetical protein IT260_05075 [Saprospiraceae bacterium]|nr:hypothetical protein [Saprospiraceae bacterium]
MNFIRQNQMLLAALVLTAALLASCRKSPEEVVALLSDTEAAELVENAVAERSAGATLPTVDMAALIENFLQDCGVPGDTTLQRNNTLGPVTYNYNFELGWLVNCNGANIPQDVQVTIEGNGAFSTAHWAGSDTSEGSLTFTGLGLQATAYVANGSYSLEGDVTGSLRNADPSLSVQTSLELKDLSIRKTDYYITGGTGTAVLVATNARGNTQTVNAALLFNGNGTVTVTVNGHSHTFPIQ